jgi:hypothetical protein
VFALVRHPVERLFSAWRDKIFLVEPGFEAYYSRLGHAKKYVEFEDFANFVLTSEDLDTCDRHWRRQTMVFEPTRALPLRYYPMHDIPRLQADLTEHLRAVNPSFTAQAELPRLNESFPWKLIAFVSENLARKVEQAYESDMKAYGFTPLHGLQAQPKSSACSIFNPWMEEIFERNRTISAHVVGFQQFVRQIQAKKGA